MNRVILLAIVAFACSGLAQSLGDVARANREHSRAGKVITNDDLKSEPNTKPADAPAGLGQELDHMRNVFRQICSDPRTDHGRKLSDYDKKEIQGGVKPLRMRVSEFEGIQKHYKEALAELDRKFEARFKEMWPTNRAATDEDVEKGKALRQEYESQKALLIKQGEHDLQPYQDLQKELESIGNECPEAAKSVPD